MLIKSFKIDHTKLNPGIYLHEIKKLGSSFITTYDIRFKKPNGGSYLSISVLHSLEHLIATFYTTNYPKDKIYFGPMGCQTGFYLVVYGKKDLKWILKTLPKLDKYINQAKVMPGQNKYSCGNYKTLSLVNAKKEWNKFYKAKAKWGSEYKILK